MSRFEHDAMTLPAGTMAQRFRPLDAKRHPLLAAMSRDEMYDEGAMMAPGGLYLAKLMAETLNLAPGMRVLDLGCGKGQTSRLLAEQYGAEVVAVDYWIDLDERVPTPDEQVRHIRADVRRGLPFDVCSFDVIFSMQACHTFAASRAIMKYLSKLLKPGGQFCIAQTCFDEEPSQMPPVYSDTDGWDAGYANYHSPDWWADHVRQATDLEVISSALLPDGQIYWEDHFLYECARKGWDEAYVDRCAWLMRQIAFSQSSSPKLTHFMLRARACNTKRRVCTQSRN